MELARTIPNIEIVSIDSMQIYRGMDIGTAKPTRAEQIEVPHHLIDIVEPSTDFSLSQFQSEAQSAIAEIEGRGAIPLLVGGTGLHLRAVIDNFEIPQQYPSVAEELEEESDTTKLHKLLLKMDPIAAGRMEETNRRRILRALEVTLGSGRPFSSYGPGLQRYPNSRFQMVAPRWSRSEIDNRIDIRFAQQIQDGFVDEVRQLIDNRNQLSRTARQALGYRQFLEHLEGSVSLSEAIKSTVQKTKKFARRQERWFRRDPRIQWFDIDENPLELIPSLVKEWRQCI
tara:strand:+ start:1640 stop:2494 length:855 start_codon:yes stop_codon:yes gene_type:complete